MYKLISKQRLNATAFVLLISTSNAGEATKTFESGTQRTHLLEVYTSQGCSSCPPADAWLNSLNGERSLLKNFIPLAFHVDYWDSLGWKDPFSQAQFTARQREIARSWGRGSVYTPGVVLDGKEWSNWGNSAPLNKSTETVGVLSATQINNSKVFKIKFTPDKRLIGKSFVLHGALAGNGLSTQVLKGENRGKLLKHDFVVFDLVETKMSNEGDAQIAFTKGIDSKATSTLATFWVTESGNPSPIQAVAEIVTINKGGSEMSKNKMSKEEKLKTLTPLEVEVTQNGGTETPFHNKYWNNHAEGIYVDIVSGEALFSSTDKFDSGTGWPSFSKPIDTASIIKKNDSKFGMERTELKSKEGDSHLGHVFDDGPHKLGGKRYCINSASLRFVPLSQMKVEGYEKYLSLFKKQ